MIELYPEFFNDVFGPIMQPGSSSHMAGPCRGGYLCHSLLGEDVQDILIELDAEGSLAGTMGTMSEDIGMLNGAAGRTLTDPDFFNIFSYLKEKGITYRISICSMKESAHVNSMKFILTGKSGRKASLVVDSIGGGMVETVRINDYKFSGKGDTCVLLVFDPDGRIDRQSLTEAVSEEQTVLEFGTGKNYGDGILYWYKIGEDSITENMEKFLSDKDHAVLAAILPVASRPDKQPQLFDTMVKWRQLAEERGTSLYEVALDYETAASGWTREQVIDYMKNTVMTTLHRRVYAIANGEVEPPVNPFMPFTYKILKNGMADAKLVTGLPAKALYYVFSARPQCPGVLNVPGPQGNGGGFLGGVLYAVQEEFGLSDETLMQALFIAAGVGAICYTRTAPTGEVIGCAGECGCCSAMAAAAVAYCMGGTPEQIETAASFALQGALGWPCDVIPGGMGMPCASRIMYVAVMSITFAQVALMGCDAVIPFHEVVDAADLVGRNMCPDLLASGRGGICTTPTAMTCRMNLKKYREGK